MQCLKFNHILSSNEKNKLSKAIQVTNQLDVEKLNKLMKGQ